ncbi:CBO0543 family protein [Neobacillus sp. NRS-1170]|uniref:CBO0543 family protein n=1 Tax=Neobacillus sp. NRS-1170 TaxID=3233898 RepID=UPI003D2D71DC
MFLLRVALCLTLVLCCWKFGDVKNWRNYYSTILYLIVNNLLYSYFVGDKNVLWKLEPDVLLNTSFSFLVQNFINFPCIVILFLTYLPKSPKKVITYLLISGFILVGIETIMFITGKVTYHNGWNYWWSVAFNFLWAIMLRFHYLKPIPAWVVSFLITAFFIIYFHVPLPKH